MKINWMIIYLNCWGFIHEYTEAWIILLFGVMAGYTPFITLPIGIATSLSLNKMADYCMNKEGP